MPARELYVVEGESAALAVRRVLDPATQSVLPMQGKPLNALESTAKRVAAHPFFAALIDEVGVGWGTTFDASGMRYERILLLMDPDADGIHCGVLLLMFFQRWMPKLLDAGVLNLVRPPWGEVVPADAGPPIRAFSDEEFRTLASAESLRGTAVTRRFRGLAALSPVTLLETCVLPATRRCERIDAPRAAAMIDFVRGFSGA